MSQPNAGVKILVIDDDPGAFTLVKQMLLTVDTTHLIIEWVDTFEKGLQALRENRYDVYLVDYRIGNETGDHLIREASNIGIDAPVILLTAYGTYDIDVAVMYLGAMDYLDKRRLTPELLERSIRYAIERKRNERELKRLNERISALEQLKTDMIRLASHDIRNPLATIALNVNLLRRFLAENDWDRLSRSIDNVEVSAERIRSVISSVLSLEHIEELHMSSFHQVDLKMIVMSVSKECSESAQTKAQRLDLYLVDGPVQVYSDAALLSQAVTNLIDNAIKYTPHGGCVNVRLRKEENNAVFEVEDNGYGVAEEDQTRIFQPFFRSKTDDDAISGIGLGLYLVKSIIIRHNGSMIFRSTQGEGSTFGFRLPL